MDYGSKPGSSVGSLRGFILYRGENDSVLAAAAPRHSRTQYLGEKGKKKGFGEWGREEELPHGGFGEVEMPRRGRDSEVPTGVEGSWVPSELGIP